MDDESRAAIVADIKQRAEDRDGPAARQHAARAARQLRRDVFLRRDRGASNYGTAGYLGHGYFITVKHGVVALGDVPESRQITSIKMMYNGRALAARDRRHGRRAGRGRSGRLGRPEGQGGDRPAAARHQSRVRVRLRRSDLPPRQRLLEGHHPVDGLRRTANHQQPGDLPDRRPSRRVGRRRVERRRPAGRHPDRPDAGGLSVLVHSAAARGDVPEGAAADPRRLELGSRGVRQAVRLRFRATAFSCSCQSRSRRLISCSKPLSVGV